MITREDLMAELNELTRLQQEASRLCNGVKNKSVAQQRVCENHVEQGAILRKLIATLFRGEV